ncbi:hypothetical protein A1Q1_07600 [Trichosporon asahii var. asahii CBS 2479]|uniref:Amino acid transporter transmembrane domain-containing protein n=1 Tax=Trichosporon asahii var. asahii (strain ATCC 90039 / CBS 2479 / JCM 2466 / KCTC 7840 / NBRC 103889/ NCYC 2677 / UAMH 7654) TaxID=1186058 RepID=J5TIX3_TRIAS|nr:hypothetical protein A1Q1_07600 [Trichosporon asahii var. asahii CBS 2479]EJT51136.1 hypothetical protein A1Q1_07600 [Trichosporon asahii var. asahii CBS 2479]
MASPRNISKSPRPSDDSEQALSSSVARAQASGSLTVGTPPLPQIPRREISNSFQARTVAERSSAKGEEPASSGSSLSGLGNKAALPAQPTSSNLTASLTLDKDHNHSKDPIDRTGTPDLDGTLTPQPDESAFSAVAGVPDEEKAKVLRRHLVSAEERTSNAPTPSAKLSPAASPGPSSRNEDPGESAITRRSDGDDDPFPIPYDAPGGDVTHEVYKWQQDHQRTRRSSRAQSFSHADRSAIIDPQLAQMKEPGGFRRNFVVARAQERGVEEPPMIRNFVDFLFLYGHFAGEDLDEDEDIDDEDDHAIAEEGRGVSRVAGSSRDATERTPLLRSRSSTRRPTRPGQGTASLTQAVLMASSAPAFCSWARPSTMEVLPDGWTLTPDIGGALYGKYMRDTILFSITVSQIGFVAAYTIFIAENLQALLLSVSDCKWNVPIGTLIFGQLLLFLPLAMIRNLAKLSGTALVADAFILVGRCCRRYAVQSRQLPAADRHFGLCVRGHRTEPQKFPRALSAVMFVVAVLFAGFGVLGYAAYGSDVQTVVLTNLPQDQKFVQVSQFLYSIAILLSIPLQLFPAVRIMETGLFSRSGKHNPRVKWQKNIFRAGTVLFCSMLSWAGSSELDKFVSLIGSFACIPLCFIYPPMLHLKACARTRTEKALDYLLIAFGVIVGLYTTVQTIRSLFDSSSSELPRSGKCDNPH